MSPIFLGMNGRQPMRAKGEKVGVLTRLWLALHGFRRFDEDPDGGDLWVNLKSGAFLAPRTLAELAVADARRAEERKKAEEEQKRQMAEANARGEGPEQQGRIVMPNARIPRRH